MKFTTSAALLACAASQAHAFSDSSPFIFLSTAKLSSPPQAAQLQTASQVLTTAQSLLASCPTKRYLLVSQPNMHAADVRSDDSNNACRMPNLCRAAEEQNSWAVAEVIGQITDAPLREQIEKSCGGDVLVERVELRHLPAASDREGAEKERGVVLSDNDYNLGRLLDVLDDDDYTILVFSDPNEFKAYEPEFGAPVHMDLKRRSSDAPRAARRQADDARDNRPLFEKYQFFTPGIFMSFIVVGIILSILGVGLKALASLEVSYGAFDKDMGPAAQKKQL
ncbi:BIG/ATPase V1 complex, subunit S1 [Chaetomium sp. MPI-SDFR-AT-0129]|nr:BIG/ATPase V1 complex, subunit S1 [Chaetomium sp. MPI-SDFR-AT-0129]